MTDIKPTILSRIRHLYPFDSNYVDINGFSCHYIDEGSGSPVIMVHGNPTWSFYFRRLIQDLSVDHRVIAFDHIGCGLSEKPAAREYRYTLEQRIDDLDELVQQLELKRKMTLVLHDWGGMIGMAFALRKLDRIGRFVLLNTAAFFPPQNRPLPLRLKLIRNFKPLASLAVLGCNAFARGAIHMATAGTLPPDVRRGLLAPYNSWRNRIATLKFVQDIPLKPGDTSFAIVRRTQDNLHRLGKIPMLICWGMRDFVFTPSYLDEWRRRFPHARVRIFDAAGHYVLEDAADGVIDAVRDFMVETQ